MALGLPFTDADSLHSVENVAKMSSGLPLDDADRLPWLGSVGALLRDTGGVVACSALRRKYRDTIRVEAPATWFGMLEVGIVELATRLEDRPAHFMPAALLNSQLATLELQPDELDVAVIDGSRPVPAVVEEIIAALRRDARST